MIKHEPSKERLLALRSVIMEAQAQAEDQSLGLCVIYLASAVRDIEDRLKSRRSQFGVN